MKPWQCSCPVVTLPFVVHPGHPIPWPYRGGRWQGGGGQQQWPIQGKLFAAEGQGRAVGSGLLYAVRWCWGSANERKSPSCWSKVEVETWLISCEWKEERMERLQSMHKAEYSHTTNSYTSVQAPLTSDQRMLGERLYNYIKIRTIDNNWYWIEPLIFDMTSLTLPVHKPLTGSWSRGQSISISLHMQVVTTKHY